MRTVAAGIASELTRSGAYPGYLIEITVASGGVLRITTLDGDFQYDGFTWATADVTVPDLSFDGTVSRGGALLFGDQTIAVWIANLYREFDDAPIRIWQVYLHAPGEALPFFIGRCGKVERRVDPRSGATASISIDADATALYAPRRRVQDVIDPYWLIPPNSVITINNQRWVIERPSTTNS